MNLRTYFLRLVATPDRAWLTLLAGALLIARECVAPGRMIPGAIGGILLIVAGYHLPAAIPGLSVAAVCLVLQARHRAAYLPALGAATATVIGARQAGTGWPAALASVVVVAILTFLIRIADLAHRRKTSTDPI